MSVLSFLAQLVGLPRRASVVEASVVAGLLAAPMHAIAASALSACTSYSRSTAFVPVSLQPRCFDSPCPLRSWTAMRRGASATRAISTTRSLLPLSACAYATEFSSVCYALGLTPTPSLRKFGMELTRSPASLSTLQTCSATAICFFVDARLRRWMHNPPRGFVSSVGARLQWCFRDLPWVPMFVCSASGLLEPPRGDPFFGRGHGLQKHPVYTCETLEIKYCIAELYVVLRSRHGPTQVIVYMSTTTLKLHRECTGASTTF